MPEDLDILRLVADNPQVSQRKIAESTGISLGQVNFLIKKLVKKGLIKIEGQTPKSIRYNLTPKGLAEKASLTLEYIRISYKAVISLTDKVRKIAELCDDLGKTIYIYGEEGEMMEIVRIALGDLKLWNCDLNPERKESIVILYWDSDRKEHLSGYESINVLL